MKARWDIQQMKRLKIRKFVQIAALTLAIAIPVGVIPASAASVEVDPTIKVGLFYGSSALPGANLLNDVGSGYRLGYYDGSRSFQELAYTGETAISVVKTQNVYYGTSGSWKGYYDTITSDIAVGCWHLRMPGSYGSFEEAAAGRNDCELEPGMLLQQRDKPLSHHASTANDAYFVLFHDHTSVAQILFQYRPVLDRELGTKQKKKISSLQNC